MRAHIDGHFALINLGGGLGENERTKRTTSTSLEGKHKPVALLPCTTTSQPGHNFSTTARKRHIAFERFRASSGVSDINDAKSEV